MLIQIPYKPRPLQAEIHNQLAQHRFGVLVCHRRFGKTVCAVNEGQKRVLTTTLKNPRVAYLCPTQTQAELVAWDMLLHYSECIPGIKPNKSKLHVDYPNGGRFKLLGAENADRLRGSYWDYVIMDEVAQMRRRVWGEIVRPALADREGGALFIGTPMGRNVFYDFFDRADKMPGWYRALITHKDSGYIPEDEIEALKLEMTTAEFEQEMLCSWQAAIRGAYYGEVMNELEEKGQITQVPHDENLSTIASFDLGMSNGMAIWFWQVTGAQIRAIEYKEFHGVGLPDVFKWIREERNHYHVDQWIGPHDLAVRELGTGISRLEVAQQHGVNFTVCRKIPRQDGIDACRSMLKRCWFDAEMCRDGIEALRQYRCEYDDKRNVYSINPLKDWTTDAADSARYFAVATSAGQRAGPMQQTPLELDLTGVV